MSFLPKERFSLRDVGHLFVQRELKDLFGHTADVVCSVGDYLPLLCLGELEVEESPALAGLEHAVLLSLISILDLLEGNCLKLDGWELGTVWERRIFLGREFSILFGVRHVS